MHFVIPLKLVYTPVDDTVTAIRNYQVPSTMLWAAVTSLNNPLGPVGDGGSAKYLLLSPKS